MSASCAAVDSKPLPCADGYDREMMTLDGGGGLYWGDVASADGTALVLTHNTSRAECMPGGNACVLDGTATGQCRRIISCDGRRKLRLEAPFASKLDGSSKLSIVACKYSGSFIHCPALAI